MLRETFWGHIPKSFQLMVVVRETSECARDSKVSETCLSVPSNQDVALDILSVNGGLARTFVCLPE